MTEPDVLERRLAESFERAEQDERWRGRTWPDPVARVHRKARAARRRAGLAAGVAVAVLAGAGAVGVRAALPRTHDRLSVVGPAGAPDAGRSGLAWLLTSQQYADYVGAHPSPSPSRDLVSTPAPDSPVLDQLRADVAAALPTDAQVVRVDAADGGLRDHAVVWVTTGAEATPVAVERHRLDYPIEARLAEVPRPTATTDGSGPGEISWESFSDPAEWPDGSAYTVLSGTALGYAFGPDQQWSGPVVWSVTPDGWFTSWTAPVGTDTLVGWAQAADRHFTGAGA